MRRYINIALSVIAGVTLTACAEEFSGQEIDITPDGYMTLEFVAQVPDMNVVQTKAVDPDGAGVQQMTIFCFDANDLFITTVTADITPEATNPSLSGKLKATVPDYTVTLQLVGNQNLTYFREDNYRGMSEIDVMASLEASAGRMIYWARKTVEELKAHNTESNPVLLLRNQAKITLNVEESVGFEQKGWVVVNSNAFGTVAPYSPEHGFEAPHYIDRPFVTLPENTTKLGDFLDVRTNEEEYIFETENTVDSPIDFIVKGSQDGGQELYYRISIIDKNGEYIPIFRNHHYTVNITGPLYYGQPTFAEALEAPATNNVWVSVSNDINSLTDGVNTLSVDQTYVVICEEEFKNPNEYYLYYNVETTGSSELKAAEVSWVEGNNVAMSAFSHTFEASTGRGTICVELNSMGDLQKREGTLLVKSGRLSRKIKVVTVKKQSFEPAWITSNVYGVQTGGHITMMFTIPEDSPQELFPMDVLISVNDIDVRNESGMVLPIITSSDERYGEDNGIGYKYVLTVEGTGTQRVYLKTILGHQEADMVNLTIEAKNFTSLTKTAIFRTETDYSIILDNVRHYSAEVPRDEVIFYYLVPQKINAPVDIVTHLGDGAQWNAEAGKYDYTPVDPSSEDQFLFYSTYLNHNEKPGVEQYFNFTQIDPSLWSTGGRIQLFTRTDLASTPDKGAMFHLLTNAPVSAEVVRIASNPESSGNQYRSAVFELANYHPFHFAAQINGQGTIVEGEASEVVDNVMLDYMPNRNVYIDLDITSFKSSIRGDGNTGILPDSEQVSVDPFGTAFDIYIDAPMLKLDESDDLVKSGKLEVHPTIEGRFVYHVNASREIESTYGYASAASVDAKAASQAGERKRLAFKAKSVVSVGDITISSEESKVVYYKKTFKVQNNSIVGRLSYRSASGVVPVPAGSFVPFEMLPTYYRIGTVTVGESGEFELRLRGEYKYDWVTDDVKFQFVLDGVTYEKTFGSLSALSNSTDIIILEPVNS
jgi:hypothetical protein